MTIMVESAASSIQLWAAVVSTHILDSHRAESTDSSVLLKPQSLPAVTHLLPQDPTV